MAALLATLALAIPSTLAIPPPNFGFPEAPNDTALVVAFPQTSGTYIQVTEADLFGAQIPMTIPIVAVNTTAYSSIASYNGSYLVCMVDPDASYPQDPTNRFLLHWLQSDMQIIDQQQQQQQTSNSSSLAAAVQGSEILSNTSEPVVPYLQPMPPTNSSAHRYIIYAFQQPDRFHIPAAFSGLSSTNRTGFNLTNFIQAAELGDPAAANYFYVSNQTAVSPTFTAAPGATYPGGNGAAVTSGDPGASALASAMASTSASSPVATPSARGSAASSILSSASASASSSSSTSTSNAAPVAAQMNAAGGWMGAGLLGLAALL